MYRYGKQVRREPNSKTDVVFWATQLCTGWKPWPGLRQRLPGEPIVNVNSAVCSRHVSVEQLNEHINK